MIALDLQPFSIVEDRGFKAFTKALNPSYILPSRQTLSKKIYIPEMFAKVFVNKLWKKLARHRLCASQQTAGHLGPHVVSCQLHATSLTILKWRRVCWIVLNLLKGTLQTIWQTIF